MKYGVKMMPMCIALIYQLGHKNGGTEHAEWTKGKEMKKISLTLAILLYGSTLIAYSATCSAGKEFNISVENKIMTIDNKYTAKYSGKTFTGWYKYSNKAYTYTVGKFDNGKFPIEVTNKFGLETEGTCYFNN